MKDTILKSVLSIGQLKEMIKLIRSQRKGDMNNNVDATTSVFLFRLDREMVHYDAYKTRSRK